MKNHSIPCEYRSLDFRLRQSLPSFWHVNGSVSSSVYFCREILSLYSACFDHWEVFRQDTSHGLRFDANIARFIMVWVQL